MAWQTPKTDWAAGDVLTPEPFNRIEGNIDILGKYDRAPGYGTATETNTKTITLNPAPGSYYDGLCFAFKNITENTGAVTINVNGLGAKSIKKPNGNDVAAGNLKAGSVYTVRYNGTNFILQGEGGEYGTAQPEHVLEGYTIGTEEGVKPGTMPNNTAMNSTITTQGGQIAIPQGYHPTGGIVKASFANLIASNVKDGINIGGVLGTLDVSKALKNTSAYRTRVEPDSSIDVTLGSYKIMIVANDPYPVENSSVAIYTKDMGIVYCDDTSHHPITAISDGVKIRNNLSSPQQYTDYHVFKFR